MSKARLIHVCIPVLAFGMVGLASLVCGSENPENLAATERNAQLVIVALEQYYGDNGICPASLDELGPVYLDELLEAVTTRGMGWLYTTTDDEYTLGYWYGANKYAVYVVSVQV